MPHLRTGEKALFVFFIGFVKNEKEERWQDDEKEMADGSRVGDDHDAKADDAGMRSG